MIFKSEGCEKAKFFLEEMQHRKDAFLKKNMLFMFWGLKSAL